MERYIVRTYRITEKGDKKLKRLKKQLNTSESKIIQSLIEKL